MYYSGPKYKQQKKKKVFGFKYKQMLTTYIIFNDSILRIPFILLRFYFQWLIFYSLYKFQWRVILENSLFIIEISKIKWYKLTFLSSAHSS